MRSASGPITLPKWQHNSTFANASQSATNNLAIPVDAMFSMLDSEQILLTGIAHRHPPFHEGINETLCIVRPVQRDIPIAVSHVTSNQSAIWVGLNAFVFSPSLNIDQLKTA